MIKKFTLMLILFLYFIVGGFSALTDNNEAYYTFDDVSPFTFHSNTQSGATGILNGAFNFDGSTDYLTTSFNGFGDESYTMNIWFKTTDDGNIRDIYSNYQGGVQAIHLSKNSLNQITLFTRDSANSQEIVFSTTETYNDGNYHLATITRDHINNELSMYIDNVHKFTGADTTTSTYYNNFQIGRSYIYSALSWIGDLDDFSIYNRVLTTQELTDLYNNGVGETAQNVANDYIYYLPFDSLRDSTLNENHLEEYASPTLSQGIINTGYNFDGINDKITTYNNILSGNSHSISFWIKPNNLELDFLIYQGDTNTDRGFLISTSATGSLYFQYSTFSANSFNTIYESPNVLTVGELQHISIIRDGASHKLYINGIEQTFNLFFGTATADNLRVSNTPVLTIGGKTVASFNGLIDEVSFWNRAINFNEVEQLYNNGNGFQFVTNPLTIEINSPIQNFNYTYDVSNLELNIDTTLNSDCTYTYNAIETPFTTTGLLNHISQFNLGAPINESLNFEILLTCVDETLTYTTEKSLIFHRQQEPLDFEIFVPQDQQHFNYDTSVIEFYIETNYVADCTYLVYNMTIPIEFSITGSSVHKTNYTAFYPNVNDYFTSFTCEGINVLETTQKNVTFIIDDMQIITAGASIEGFFTDTGGGLGSFFNSISTPIIYFLIAFSIVGSIGAIILAIANRLKKGL